MIRKRKRKRAFTLIEILISISMTMILGGICITLIISSIKEYKNASERMIFLDKLDNCMLNIDVICNSNGIKDIKVIDNYGNGIKGKCIVITYFQEKKFNLNFIKDKVIYLSQNKLMVKTLSGKETLYELGDNTIIDNISQFNVYIKGNLIYFCIITKFGDEITRCL